jgi:uncharacterized protein YgbK (DUF1537 family)
MSVCVVLDDDPTGTQELHDVPVLLRWDDERLRRAADRGRPALHLMTNIRALDGPSAERVTRDAVEAVRRVLPAARIVLRGDSTLRGHVAEEYRAVREAGFAGRAPALLLVPALPAAGRITRDGVHRLLRDGDPVPLHETEYARDGGFAYRSARLLEWVEERSGGELAAARGTELPLARLRAAGGADAVAEAIAAAASSGEPAACAPDAETVADLELIAEGLRHAEARGVEVVVRCAPTFAGVLSGTLATEPVPPPHAGARGVLVACGSYVSLTTRQLSDLSQALGVTPIELDVLALVDGDADAEVRRVAAAAREALDRGGLAVVATPRERPHGTTSLAAGARVADGLARVVAAIRPLPDVVIAKGGITSQVVLERGLGVSEATVVGPVAPGVGQWRVAAGDHDVAYLVFPGNVGTDHHLTDVVRSVLGG